MKIHNHPLPKSIRRHSIRRWLATAATLTAMLTATLATLTGCSADNDPETATGGTSVTFGATIAAREGHDNGNAPASRAIPDGTFEEGDQILVHMDGKRKAFIYSTAQGFVHAPNYPGANVDPTPPVWKSGEAEKSLLAYGPTACISSAGEGEYIYEVYVSTAQNDDREYKYSDYVYTAQTLYRSNPALSFRHGMARVVLRLRSGGSLTDEDVAGATVELGDENLFTRADIDPQTGTLTAHVPTGGNELQPQTITPHRCADTPAGYAVAYEALLPPQDVSGKAFIIVKLANGKELGYAAESGSMLEGGHEYVYNVTVKVDRLAVTVTDSDVPWQDGVFTTKIDGKEFRLIRTAEDLKQFADDVNGGQRDLNALQTADIDLGGIDNWEPINYVNDLTSSFTGIYNGNGYTISNLKIRHLRGRYSGLFGQIGNGALLTGIHLRDVEIMPGSDGTNIGTVAGLVQWGATVSLCSAQGKINVSGSGTQVGGLVGSNIGTVTRCRTDVTVTIDVTLENQLLESAGGITGRNESLVFACHAIGSVTLKGRYKDNTASGRLYAGGIVGSNLSSSANNNIYCCIAEGDVTIISETEGLSGDAGGLAGYHQGGAIRSCYARGNASFAGTTSSGAAGAIVGQRNSQDDDISYCYGVGAVGKGTSNISPKINDIVYNTNPGAGDIYTLMTKNVYVFDILFTRYDPDATPAYGIVVQRKSSLLSRDFWLSGDGTWPVIDFARNPD